MEHINKNICALATPQGSGAIGVIRLSGPDVISIVDNIFVPGGKSKASLADTPAYKMRFGSIYDGERLLDEVLVSVFHAPHSYTGENSVEISCHGSSYILQQVMLLLLKCGIKMAEPGEFSKRAFLNGKLDLAQAEAVADLIASETAAAHQVAMKQMKGGFSNELRQMRDSLLNLVSMMELELDFSEEDVEFADRTELLQLCDEVDGVMSRLASSFSVGNAVKNGVPVAIVGETNTGKSTLLNALLREDRAIVSDICGTTRDTIEGLMTLSGVSFRFIDTAGLRETHDVVERMGIERTLEQLAKSSIALWLIDPTAEREQIEELAKKLLPVCREKKLAVLVNKCDIVDPITLSNAMEWGAQMVAKYGESVEWNSRDLWAISARQGTNLDRLEEFLVRSSAMPSIAAGDVVVTNVRHYEALVRAIENIKEVKQGLADGISCDLVSEPLRAAIRNLSEILGEVTSDEILGNIFANFCIGK